MAFSNTVKGIYGKGSDIENRFGIDNCARWSNLDNAVTTSNDARGQLACNFADSEITNYWQFSWAAIPLSPINPTITDWFAVMAGNWLYNSRGLRDKDDWDDKLRHMLADSMRDMAMYKNRSKWMILGKVRTMPACPTPY